MSVILVTGSAGLVGSEAVSYFCEMKYDVIGIDNDIRGYLFGEYSSTKWRKKDLIDRYKNYVHFDIDIRDNKKVEEIFAKYNSNIVIVIHTAAQPSHDWAVRDPNSDFTINANGTSIILECTRKYCPEAIFIYTSTNKVYGDAPNKLPLIENGKRWNLDNNHKYAKYGIDESMGIDNSIHSLFGVSKLAGDLLVQEYGKYFGMKTACFRGGCITGPSHSGAQLHGFLSYMMICFMTNTDYYIYGYKGKQVRDNIHSKDLINAFYEFYKNPKNGEVFNIGGGIYSNCSVLEAIDICESLTKKRIKIIYNENNRIGDHIWWISDVRKFQKYFQEWKIQYNIRDILEEMHDHYKIRYK